MIDHFVTPSEFLRKRYVEWGLPADRVTVIENGQGHTDKAPPRPLKPSEDRTRFAFFGQLNPYKGIDVLLLAAAGLSKQARARITIEIHGANLEYQEPKFRELIEKLLAPLEEEGVVRFVGPYMREDLPRRMARTDWVLVPSIWWENSPMVIQEAFTYGRPVVCSNIGGMAEKVRHGIDGWHVETRSVRDWAETIERLASDRKLWQQLYDGIRAPLTYAECVDAHMAL